MNAPIKNTQSLTWETHPRAELMRLSWPLVVSLTSVSVMTLVDTLFIGRLGARPLAATGLGGICVFTVLSFGFAIFGAAKVHVSECFGREDEEAVRRQLGGFLRLALVLGIVSTAVGLQFFWLMPHLTPDQDTASLAGIYAGVRSLAFVFALVSAAIGQWLQAQGDTRSSMQATLVANVVNVPLNALFIFGMDGGVLGAAAATVGACLVEVTWLLSIQRSRTIRLPGGRTTVRGFHLGVGTWADAFHAFRRGLPMGIQQILDMMAFASVPLLLSSMGPAHLAAHQIVLQIMLFSFLPLFALSESISVMVAQALGAGRERLVGDLVGVGMKMALGYALIVGALCLWLAAPLIGLFTPDPTVIDVGTATLTVGAVLQLLNAAYVQFKGALRGHSVFSYVAWVTIGCAWVITPPLTYYVGVRSGYGAPGAWFVLCVEVAMGTVLLGHRTLGVIGNRG